MNSTPITTARYGETCPKESVENTRPRDCMPSTTHGTEASTPMLAAMTRTEREL